MGCAQSDQTFEPTLNYFKLFQVPSGSIETTQVFMLINDYLSEVKNMFFEIECARLIMFRITKVSLISNPTILDAYIFWTSFVYLCNQGNQGENQTLFSLKGDELVYDLGMCGDLKLQWFGQLLNKYISNVIMLKLKLPVILEQLKTINETMIRLIGRNELKNSIVIANQSRIKTNSEFTKLIQVKISRFADEYNELRQKHQAIEQQSEQVSKQLYNKYGVQKIQQSQSIMAQKKTIMKVKANTIIQQCFSGKFRTELEEDIQNIQKQERAQSRPNMEKGDDVGGGIKKFPFRIRWTGCKLIDQSLGVLSHYLEEQGKQLLFMRKFSIFIRYLTQSYKCKEDNLGQAYKFFCQSLNSQQRTIIQSKPTLIEGFKILKLVDPIAQKCRHYIVEFVELFQKDRLSRLDEMWANYLVNQQRIIILWSDNLVLTLPEFLKLSSHNQYYALSSLSKNVYALQHYFPVAVKVYSTTYQKKLKQGMQFLGQLNIVYEDSKCLNQPLEQIHLNFEAEEDQNKLQKKYLKFKYAYEKFNKNN